MVYKAVQAFLSDKAQAFLPGNSLYPEEDKYASQFDPWSIGNRPITKSWINISVNIQIGYAPQDHDRLHNPAAAPSISGDTINPTPATKPPTIRSDAKSKFDNSRPDSELVRHDPRGTHQAAFDRIMGNAYGHSTIRGGMAHFGDIYHYHYSQTQTQVMHRRNSDSMTGMRRPSIAGTMQELTAIHGPPTLKHINEQQGSKHIKT